MPKKILAFPNRAIYGTIAVEVAPEFLSWFSGLNIRVRGRIESRIERIADHGHFGSFKYLGNGLSELPWKNGLRLYFWKMNPNSILLLFGGIKNGQKKDIQKARHILQGHPDRRA